MSESQHCDARELAPYGNGRPAFRSGYGEVTMLEVTTMGTTIRLDVTHPGNQGWISRGYARLAPWQIKAAMQSMALQLRTGLRIADVAERFELSETHFSKAFRNSVGVAPYRWFQGLRVMLAQRLLTDSSLSLAEISSECGYSDQSHFITAFSRAIGMTPGRWRRRQGAVPSRDLAGPTRCEPRIGPDAWLRG
ncbi:MAG: helix-turn-helix domain-containing protein [Tsuneonella suprasediminis]